jgi:hypothetical protein
MGEEERVSSAGKGEVSHATWRKRFFLMFGAQVGGTAIALFGLLLWQTNYLVEGGSVLGLGLALLGLAISFFVPRVLAGRWKRQDR